ncbi:hypothetical protein [Chryseobacterium sp. Marseille-Q8038]
MIIQEKDYMEVIDYLKATLDRGEKYIAYDFNDESNNLDHIKSLPTFQSHFDAIEYSFEYTTDVDLVSYLSIEWAHKAMLEAIKDPSLLIKIKNGQLIDIGLTTFFYLERLEKEQTNTTKNQDITNENYSKNDKKVDIIRQIGKESPFAQQKDKQDQGISDQKKINKPKRKRGFGF